MPPVFLQPANATEQAVSDLLNDVKSVLGKLLSDVKGLTGLDASGLLGDITDVNAVGKTVADLLKVSLLPPPSLCPVADFPSARLHCPWWCPQRPQQRPVRHHLQAPPGHRRHRR